MIVQLEKEDDEFNKKKMEEKEQLELKEKSNFSCFSRCIVVFCFVRVVVCTEVLNIVTCSVRA